MKILVYAKWLISRFRCINNYCKRCGRYTEPYTVDDDVYRFLVPGQEELCFHCLNAAANRQGIWPVWRICSLTWRPVVNISSPTSFPLKRKRLPYVGD